MSFNALLEFRIRMNDVIKDIVETSKAKTIGLVGIRGNTKTYSIHKLQFESIIEGYTAVEYFRTIEDIKAKKNSILEKHDEDIVEGLHVDNFGLYYLEKKIKHYKMLFIPINKSNRFKSVDLPKPLYHFLDEFIPEDGLYLGDELKLLNAALASTNRYNENSKIILASNTVKSENIYFMMFDVKLEDFKPIYDYDGLDITKWTSYDGEVEFYKLPAPPDYNDMVKNSIEYSWGQRTGYNEMAINNKFVMDDKDYVVNIDVPTNLLYNVAIKDRIYSIHTYKNYYVFKDYEYNEKPTYEFKTDGMSRNSLYKPMSFGQLKRLKALYLSNRVVFANPNGEFKKDIILKLIVGGAY